jgi:hypothetical protein
MGAVVGSHWTTARKAGVAVVALVCLLALTAGPASAARKPLPRPVPVADDALARALASGRLTHAGYALERARSLFQLRAVRDEFGDVARPKPHDASLILRDLAVRLGDLPPAERQKAERLLARPSDGRSKDPDGWKVSEAPASPVCDANVCIHWVASTADAPPPTDSDSPTDGVPDWIENVVQPTFANVWSEEIDPPPAGLGNPAPLSDLSSRNDGGDGRLDIYLANLGDDLIFGYCSSDDPNLRNPDYPFFAFSAYCVLDDNFADFGSQWTRTQFNQIVAAHEFRHASQFAEDFLEDAWLMEGDAMWTEGQVYPEITDRWDYLDTSPLGRPGRALDHGTSGYEYGAWIFFRYLSERFDPAVIREAWEFADDNGSGPDQFSMQAVASALAARGEALSSEFTTFAEWNRSPSRFYLEGAEYSRAPTANYYRLDPAETTGWRARTLRHLANAYYSFYPRSTLGPTATLRVAVDLPARRYRPAARLLVFHTSGAYDALPISLDGSGFGKLTVAFGRGVVSRVDLVLTNASSRYDMSTCWSGRTTYSCGGAVALDENRTFRFKGSASP